MTTTEFQHKCQNSPWFLNGKTFSAEASELEGRGMLKTLTSVAGSRVTKESIVQGPTSNWVPLKKFAVQKDPAGEEIQFWKYQVADFTYIIFND